MSRVTVSFCLCACAWHRLACVIEGLGRVQVMQCHLRVCVQYVHVCAASWRLGMGTGEAVSSACVSQQCVHVPHDVQHVIHVTVWGVIPGKEAA
jgi:hypothetical protein